MDRAPVSTVPRCPDCGGILEPTCPRWMLAVDPSSAGTLAAGDEGGGWRCLLCGYRISGTPLEAEAESLRTA